MLTTKLCTLLGIDFPIINAPMAGTAASDLATAVSKAGAFGMIGCNLSPDPVWITEQIQAVREKTDQPFGVGFISSAVWMEKAIEAALDAKVTAISHSFVDPTPFIEQAKGSGVKIFAQVQTMANARKAVAAGADVIIAQGNEAGGHTSYLGTLSFVRAVVKIAGDIPVVAAGGIADGPGLAAALMLGAEGVWMGTRFVASLEWAGPEWAKGQVILADADDTVSTNVYDLVSDAPFPLDMVSDRVIRNTFTDTWHDRTEAMMARQSELMEDIATATATGDATTAPVRAGGASAIIRSVEPASYILREIVSQAADILKNRTEKLLGG
ncbi:MAG: 2-nitropropane dioxygenase [Chloroflexi bacterium]|jgi:nitronate monooxygenase|nr:2-nitropropane dioxygenase [Chloroflexota bacterium]MDP6497084.1 nitronate monooxygenase [Dehalococcoidia bacterium]MQG10910.1 nitronate monooxygenase [SAR202 cluster bacterium]MQG54405.1 nitronate monooxygenase [SAR202 cluster bacterium]|tara:strand:- start:340 stop:1317 length:978 start_codon:yes stop_codon:yes gene_type:complete